MKTWSWVVLGILAFLLVILLAFGGWVLLLGKPSPGINCRERSDWLWSPTCKYIEEKFPDPSLQDPSNLKLYLIKFSQVRGAGPPVCLPMWYCFRYVNVKTGGYSGFSKWTDSPVSAGGDNLPCLDGVGKCDNLVPQGKRSCNFNQPLIGIPNLQYNPLNPNPDGSFIFANIHRYVGNPGDTSPPGPPEKISTEIIGYLIPNKVAEGVKYAWPDILFNPCKVKSCGRCMGC